MSRKVAVVTGSSRGIGKAIVLALARDGYDVVVHARERSKQALNVAEEIRQMGVRAEVIPCEVTDGDETMRWARQIRDKLGMVEVLVNNAGVTDDAMFDKMSDEGWGKVIETNLTGVFRVTKAILPLMVDGGGIVNMGSVVGLHGGVGQANYAAAKAGLVGLTKSLALELAKKKIRVNLVAPGYVETEMTMRIPEKIMKQKVLPKIAWGRMAEAEEVANVVAFLCSEKASYMTGAVVEVDGGMGV